MNKINYVIGDATAPEAEGMKIIVHVCNDIGAWGAGFVLALSKKWKKPEEQYRAKQYYRLGDVDLVFVGDNIMVANMIGQHCIGRDEDGFAPVRYSAIAEGLKWINKRAVNLEASLHCPRFGSDLAGGDWDVIERLIRECTTVPVTVYDLPIDKSIGIGRAIIQ
jgi:O-acetyl-ADP-ribose deacetylase (regulator of RNase III)